MAVRPKEKREAGDRPGVLASPVALKGTSHRGEMETVRELPAALCAVTDA
jgi:hypothetical protein